MLTTNDIHRKIDSLVDEAYLPFVMAAIGTDLFSIEQKRKIEALGLIIGSKSLIELLYILIRNRPQEGYAKHKSINYLLDEVAQTKELPVAHSIHKHTIDHAKAQLAGVIDTTKESLKQKVKQEVLKVNNEYKNQTLIKPITDTLEENKRKEKYIKLLTAGLIGAGLLAHERFVKGFTTSLTETINNAVVDEGIIDSALAGLLPGNALYIKRVTRDRKLCPYCDALYTNADGTPKVFKLSELQTNGTNDGRPRSAWRAVIGATHFRCRCQLEPYKSEPDKE